MSKTMLLIILLIINVFCDLKAQFFSGKIIDKETAEAIPFVHVYHVESGSGTVSNEMGEFSLRLNKPQAELLLSHISYESKLITTVQGEILTIELLKSAVIMEEVTVNFPLFRLLEEVRTVVMQVPTVSYGKTFYRQITSQASRTTELIESFYEMSYNQNGVQQIKMKQARYAKSKPMDDLMLNFTFVNFSSIPMTYQVFSERSMVANPFIHFDDFNFRLEEVVQHNNDSIFQIAFHSSERINSIDSMASPVSGRFWFNKNKGQLQQYDVLIEHGLGADELKLPEGYTSQITNPEYFISMQFSEQTFKPRLIYATYTAEMHRNDTTEQVKVIGKLVFYEDAKKSYKKLNEPSIEINDLKKVRGAKYKARFWRDNPIIKHTGEEELLINQLEAENAFGTYFKK